MRARRLAARWLIPVEGPPIECAALLIGADGRIDAVGPDPEVARPAGIAAEDFGEAVILPGLINTHTHLELTGFADQVQEPDFATWIRRLRELKTTRSADEYVDAARRGLQACYAAGVTTIADTGDSGATIQALAESDGSGVAYQEVFGPHPSQAQESLAGLRDRVIHAGRWAVHRVRIGVSPHAPYTVSEPLLKAVANWAGSEGLPLAVHVAESPAESELLATGTGPFAEAWRARGIPLPPTPWRSPIEWLAAQGALTERTLCIHAVQAEAADIELLARHGAAVAHCPLSNAAHGHGEAPLSAMLNAAVRVGLGTDSEVSVGRPDLLAEARAAAALAGLTAHETVELATLAGARALGLDSETGSLREGKWADCIVIKPTGPGSGRQPAERVLGTSSADLLLTCLAGRDVYRAL
jgi:5-methylthioadenosine/S-adenosylhomocysteine deaminase